VKFGAWLLSGIVGLGFILWLVWPNSIEHLEQSANEGNADAQDRLGNLYDEGKGITKDYAKAAYWFQKAADQGNADAQDMLAGLYQNGDGVDQQDDQAASWYEKAAVQGNADAEEQLGYLYYQGDGGKPPIGEPFPM
jgi:TPR repeat protein